MFPTLTYGMIRPREKYFPPRHLMDSMAIRPNSIISNQNYILHLNLPPKSRTCALPRRKYTSRFNHHTHNTLPLLPQLITEDLESLVDTSMLMTSNIGYATEPVSATTTPSCGILPRQSSIRITVAKTLRVTVCSDT